jgi:GTP diphosphokinase / guanosine-3',5'-bis(diphosphate) 3'-diphosphatase
MVIESEVILLARAWRVAAERHVDQRRKGEKAEPYVNHLAEVAELVAEATQGNDPRLVAAAVLHDTVEDTGLTQAELVAQFGVDIASLVAEVTDDKGLPKEERKRRQIDHAPQMSSRAKVLKLADKTSNIRSIAISPPSDWALERKQQYLQWGRDVVAGLRGANAWLEGQFDEAAEELERLLEDEARQEGKHPTEGSKGAFICPECSSTKVRQVMEVTTAFDPAHPWSGVLGRIVCDGCGSTIPAHLGERWDGLSIEEAQDQWRKVYRQKGLPKRRTQ